MTLLLLLAIVAPLTGSDQTGEVCDGMDNDGDGLVDEYVRRLWYLPEEEGDTCRVVWRWQAIPPWEKAWRCDCPYGYVPACIY